MGKGKMSLSKGDETKKRLNKLGISKEIEKAMPHDGRNFSLIAVGREAELDDVSALSAFYDYTKSLHDAGADFKNMNGHIAVQIGDDFGYIHPIGHNDGSGFQVWDYHINNVIKNDFLKFIKNE